MILSELAQHERDELGNFFDIYRSLDEHGEAVSEGTGERRRGGQSAGRGPRVPCGGGGFELS
jgi:hypothetical protein